MTPQDFAGHSRSQVRGTVVVEVAVGISLVIMLLVMITDASAAWRVKNVLQTAVREGARIASGTPGLKLDDPGVLAVVDDVAQQSWPDLKTCLAQKTCTRTVQFVAPLKAGDPVTVRFVFDYTPVISGMIPDQEKSIHLTSSSTMRYEVRGSPPILGKLPPPAPK